MPLNLKSVPFKHTTLDVKGCGLPRKAINNVIYLISQAGGEDNMENAWEAFAPYIYDPPRYLDETALKELNMSAQGLTYFQDAAGIWHVLDWIGENNYPNAADILVEICYKNGTACTKLDERVALLTPGQSNRYFVVPNGVLLNPEPLLEQRVIVPGIPQCFLGEDERDFHQQSGEFCAALHFEDVMYGTKWNELRLTTRRIGDIEYPCAVPPKGFRPKWGVAIVAYRPILEAWAVIGNPDENSNEVNNEIQKTLDLGIGLDLQLPFFAVDN